MHRADPAIVDFLTASFAGGTLAYVTGAPNLGDAGGGALDKPGGPCYRARPAAGA